MPVIPDMRREDGNVLVIAIMMMMLMLAIGLSTMAGVDTQTDVSKKDRQRESTFNLTEAVLNAQTFLLGRLGTGNLATPFPVQCPATPASALCPDPQKIANSYDAASQPDFAPAETNWTTIVRDNGSPGEPPFYDPALEATAARYDQNEDRQMWVKSTAVVRGKTRSIVALIKVEDRPIAFPEYGISAGFFYTTNNGNKVIVDSTGSLGVAVRCSPATLVNCLGYDAAKGQLTPAGNTTTNYSSSTAISTDDLQGLEDYAKASGTYYTSCPTNPNGQVVVIEAGDCVFNNSSPAASGEAKCCNSAGKPGLLIIKRGTLTLLGSITYEGLIYMPNQQNSSGTVVTTGGTALIRGGVTIDGPGGLAAGSSGLNIKFNIGAFQRIHTIGTAGVVQNTWREIIG